MAFTKSIIQRSSTRTIIKILASAQTDNTPIYLKQAVTLTTPGNFTFTKATSSANGGTIQRASGSWLTDFTNANFAGGGGINALGQYCVAVTAGPTNSGNIRHYNIIGFVTTSTTNDTAVISPLTPVAVTEGPVSVTQNAYYSDVIGSGGTITGTPVTNINNVWASTVTGGGAILSRNSVAVLGLYGGGGDYGQHPPCVPIPDNNSYDVAVTWQTGSTTGGCLVVEMVNISGFGSYQPDLTKSGPIGY